MRDDERETAVARPPESKAVTGRDQPRTTIIAAGAEQARTAIGILDGLMHCYNPAEPHSLDLLVREFLTDKASNFGIGLGPLPTFGFDADITCDQFLREELALDDGNVIRDTVCGLEVFQTENVFGVVPDTAAD